MSLELNMSAKKPGRRAAPKGAAHAVSPDKTLRNALGDAAWAEADRALARAMAELEEVEQAATAVRRAEALMLLRQALARAARVRGFARLGAEPGETEPYDPQRHELITTPAKPPAEVVIIAQGVSRGNEVLVKARARAVRKRPAP